MQEKYWSKRADDVLLFSRPTNLLGEHAINFYRACQDQQNGWFPGDSPYSALILFSLGYHITCPYVCFG